MFEAWVEKLLKGHVGEVKLEVPPDMKMGDFAFPCFGLAKAKKKSPALIAKELTETIKPDNKVVSIEAQGPYVNFFLNKQEVAKEILTKIFEDKKEFGRHPKKGKTVVVEFSSPNIAKPFGIGHLRSTVIGNSLLKLYIFAGYKGVAINHLGDWGTQFGKEIAAWKLWGDKKRLKEEGVLYLLELYVKFHEEAEKDPALNDQGREWFAKLEGGDKEAVELWQLFRDVSLNEFERIYKVLNVRFDFNYGEAFYAKQQQEVIDQFKKKGLAQESEGALVVEVGLKHAPPLMLLKSNGTSTYHTRDLATALWRVEKFTPHKVLYCVGSEQVMHFEQLFKALELYGLDQGVFEHIVFGRYRFPEAKMSTRKGNIIFMEDVLDKAIELAEQIIEEKNPGLKDKKKVARQVGVGAVVFGDLVNDRTRNIIFDWDRILDFEGETGPYIQYTHARCCSILRKAEHGPSPKADFSLVKEQAEERVVMLLSKFPGVIDEATHQSRPHILARYLLDLCQEFNRFYQKCPVLSADEQTQKLRLLIVDCIRQVTETGLSLLGIEAPDEM